MGRLRTIILGVLGAAGITLAALGAPAVAATAAPHPAVPRTCQSGTTGFNVNHGLSTSQASVWFVNGTTGQSHPSQCMAIRPEVTWTDQGITHHAYGGWIVSQGITSTAFGPNPGPAISSAREERQWATNPPSHRECRGLYPNGPPNTSWHPCTG